MGGALVDRLHGQSAWWPRLAVAAATLAAIWFGVALFWRLLAGPELPPLPPRAVDSGASVASAPAASVAQWHLFGNASATFDPREAAEVAPETALRLTLRGTFSESAPGGGIAIIADEQGVDRGYRVGDTLPGDARLEAIYSGRVLLSRNGSNESLSLPRASEAGAPAASGTTPRAAAVPSGTPAAPRYPGFVNPAIAPGVPQLSNRGLAGTDIAELAKQVNVVPVLENGKLAGVRLRVGRDSDLLSRHGLRSSDVVTAVNGVPLDGPERQVELMNSLRDARQVTLTVRRDGQTMQIPVGL